jgi:exodeoxyribonuclease VII large subunit
MIKPYFESTTGESLQAGLKVLVQVTVEFHEVYGFSLNVQDIDPQYTLGDMARQRALVIEQLKADGILEMNKLILLPMVPQRIAVISSDTAAGWGDFNDQLKKNQYGYDFNVQLFTAVMQGDKAPASIIDALNQVFFNMDDFDVVVIIRGGGSKTDLLCFDNYDLASHIAQFPLPVLTGIGHERDDSVADMVAHSRLKTPTALATFLIERVFQFEQQLNLKCDMVFEGMLDYLHEKETEYSDLLNRLEFANRQIINYHTENLAHQKVILQKALNQFFISKTNTLNVFHHQVTTVPSFILRELGMELNRLQKQLNRSINTFTSNQTDRIDQLTIKSRLLDPNEILKRGYAIVRKSNKLIRSKNQVAQGDILDITLSDGKFRGIVQDP